MVSLRSRTTIDTRQMTASKATATAKLTPAVRKPHARAAKPSPITGSEIAT